MRHIPRNHSPIFGLFSPLTIVGPDEASHDGGRQDEANGGDSGAIKRGHRFRASVVVGSGKESKKERERRYGRTTLE